MNNRMKLEFSAVSVNESFARTTVAAFAAQLDPLVEDITEIKTAVSEAVTNAIVHGYPGKIGDITMEAWIDGGVLHINVFDNGVGIENLNQALEPFYTTREDEERSDMGFTIMRSFMDEMRVESKVGEGTKIYMSKIIKTGA